MKLVILDRDGVINEDSPNYIKSVAEWQPIPGSLEAIARLTQAGIRVFVATNQSAVGRGLIDFDGLFAINDRMRRAVAEVGGRIDGIAYAPDLPGEGSPMRKPEPGMLLDILRRAQAAPEDVPMVGDSLRDLEATRNAGVQANLVRTGNGRDTEAGLDAAFGAVSIHDDLAAFVDAWLARQI